MFWSSTNWEGSLYGGFEKILHDFPTIKTSFDVRTSFNPASKLPWNSKSKLADLFQLKVKEFGVSDYLLANAEVKELPLFYGSSIKSKCLVPAKEDVQRTINYIKESDTELGSLFDHYEKELLDATIQYIVDDEDSKSEDSGAPTKSMTLKEAKEKAEEIIGETKKFEHKGFKSGVTLFDADAKELKEKAYFVNMLKHKIEKKKVKYSAEEEASAKRLINLLDISFDPKADKVDNLRNGKLDIAKIATVHSGNTRVYYKVEENISTKPFAVCILMDESGSMDLYRPGRLSSNADYQHSIVKILYKTFSEIIPKDKIYIYGHSGDEESHDDPEIRIYHDPYNQNFEDVFEAQSHISFNENYDGIVIEKIYDSIRSKTSENILFISVSDGQPSGNNYGGEKAIDEMKRVIERCRRDGFVTVGIGLRYDRVKEIYSYSTVINDLEDTSKLVSTLVNKVVKLEFQNDEG
jgi:nitric oxide reductase activation protein